MKYLLVLLFSLLITFTYSQGRKKTVYLDTLGNRIDLMKSISIRNTGKYTWVYDESDDKTRYIKWRSTSKKEYDSLRAKTYEKSLIQEKLGAKFNYTEFKDINGETYSIDQLKNKVLVINFWFVGCGPCEIEMPELNELVNNFKNKEEVLFISFARSSQSKVLKFLAKNPFNYAVIIMTDEQAKEFKISAFPTNYVIDKHGTYHHASKGIGVAAVDILKEKIETALEK